MPHDARGLARLVDLRARALDAATVELARRHGLGERMRQTSHRLHEVLREVGRETAGNALLAANGAHYKASLVNMIGRQHRELAAHHARQAMARQALQALRLEHERLSCALRARQRLLRREANSRDQKRQDRLATQAWVHAHRPSPFVSSAWSQDGNL